MFLDKLHSPFQFYNKNTSSTIVYDQGTSIKFHCLLSVLQMKPGNKKEPKGSGLHRLHKAFTPEYLSIEFCTFFFISNRVTTKSRGKSLNVACTLGHMQSPLLIIIFLCLKLTFQFINFLLLYTWRL